jgi:RHS repeat-associated protein
LQHLLQLGLLQKSIHQGEQMPFVRFAQLLNVLPCVAPAGEVKFDYTFSGEKTRMQISGSEPEDRLYLGGAEFVFDPDAGIYLPDNYQHEEGRWQYRNDDYEQEPKPNAMQYQITDHLGNLAVLFSDANNDGHVTSENETSDPDEIEVLQRHFYYPFGMDMDGTWLRVKPYEDRYRYNHKELTKGLGWYAYGARYYDAAIGRFAGVDPIADQFPHVTTFNYAEDSPIRYIDLHGLQAELPPVGAVIGGTIRAGYEHLKYSIWRNTQIVFYGADPKDIPYREYGVTQNEWTGEVSVTYDEYAEEPGFTKRTFDTFKAGLDVASVLPGKGEVATMAAKAPGVIIPSVARQFDNFQCVDCADAILAALKQEGITGEIVTIQANSTKRGFIWSDTAGEVISKNGHHQGVLVEGKVYDNIHTEGIDYDVWRADFDVVGGFKEH